MKLDRLKKYRFSVILALIGGLAFFAVSMLFLRKFESKAEMLVIQKQSNWKIDDAYSAAKSAETTSSLLAHAIETTSFLDRVMGSGFISDKFLLNYNLEDRKEQWNKMIKASSVKNSGIIRFSVFYPNKEGAEQFASAIAYILRDKADQYHGGGDRIEVKTIDGLITSESPVSPFLGFNTLLGAVAGLFAGIILDKREKKEEKKDEFNFAKRELNINPFFSQKKSLQVTAAAEPPKNLPS